MKTHLLDVNVLLARSWPDHSLAQRSPRRARQQQITGAYLLALAMHHRGKLATWEKGLLVWGSGQSVEAII